MLERLSVMHIESSSPHDMMTKHLLPSPSLQAKRGRVSDAFALGHLHRDGLGILKSLAVPTARVQRPVVAAGEPSALLVPVEELRDALSSALVFPDDLDYLHLASPILLGASPPSLANMLPLLGAWGTEKLWNFPTLPPLPRTRRNSADGPRPPRRTSTGC